MKNLYKFLQSKTYKTSSVKNLNVSCLNQDAFHVASSFISTNFVEHGRIVCSESASCGTVSEKTPHISLAHIEKNLKVESSEDFVIE